MITSRAEAGRPDASELRQRAVAEALVWGSDRSDRFQTAARWRGEVTPKEAPADRSAEGPRLLPGWSTWRHTAASWPDESAYVVLVDERSRIVPGWMIAVAVLAGLGSGTARGRRWGIAMRACRDVRIADSCIFGCRRGLTASPQGSSPVRCRSSSSGSVHPPGYGTRMINPSCESRVGTIKEPSARASDPSPCFSCC